MKKPRFLNWNAIVFIITPWTIPESITYVSVWQAVISRTFPCVVTQNCLTLLQLPSLHFILGSSVCFVDFINTPLHFCILLNNILHIINWWKVWHNPLMNPLHWQNIFHWNVVDFFFTYTFINSTIIFPIANPSWWNYPLKFTNMNVAHVLFLPRCANEASSLFNVGYISGTGIKVCVFHAINGNPIQDLFIARNLYPLYVRMVPQEQHCASWVFDITCFG